MRFVELLFERLASRNHDSFNSFTIKNLFRQRKKMKYLFCKCSLNIEFKKRSAQSCFALSVCADDPVFER